MRLELKRQIVENKCLILASPQASPIAENKRDMSYLIPNILFYTLTMRANSWLLKMFEIRFLRICSDCCGPQKSLACYRH